MGWIYLLLAGFFEIGFALALKYSENFTRKPYIIAFCVCAVGSFGFLAKALESLPLGTAYAIWTGIGASGTMIFGLFFLKETATLPRLFFLALLLISLIGLRLTTASK